MLSCYLVMKYIYKYNVKGGRTSASQYNKTGFSVYFCHYEKAEPALFCWGHQPGKLRTLFWLFGHNGLAAMTEGSIEFEGQLKVKTGVWTCALGPFQFRLLHSLKKNNKFALKKYFRWKKGADKFRAEKQKSVCACRRLVAKYPPILDICSHESQVWFLTMVFLQAAQPFLHRTTSRVVLSCRFLVSLEIQNYPTSVCVCAKLGFPCYALTFSVPAHQQTIAHNNPRY